MIRYHPPGIIAAAVLTGLIMVPDMVRGDALSRKNGKGNKLYHEEKYGEALKMYRDAQIESPESAELHYNLGNTLYRKKKFEEAKGEFEKALSTDDPLLQQKSYYNLGNCDYRAGLDLLQAGKQEGLEKFKQSIESYKKALVIKSDDENAKFNIEFVQKKLKEMAQNSDQNKNNPNKDKEKEKENQQQQQDKQQGDQQDQDKQKKKEAGDKEDQKNKDGEEQPQPQPKPGEERKMSKEEAKRILDALKSDEKDLQKKLRKMPGKRRGVVKDW